VPLLVSPPVVFAPNNELSRFDCAISRVTIFTFAVHFVSIVPYCASKSANASVLRRSLDSLHRCSLHAPSDSPINGGEPLTDWLPSIYGGVGGGAARVSKIHYIMVNSPRSTSGPRSAGGGRGGRRGGRGAAWKTPDTKHPRTGHGVAYGKLELTPKDHYSIHKPDNAQDTLRVIVMGGNEEVGKNMTILEYGEDIIIIDMGIQFGD
jgi:hypothetical protein